jgi:phage-related protein
MDSGRDITSLSKEDLDLQTKRLSSQKEMQGVMDNLANSSSALKTGFSDMFEPIAAFVMPVLNDLFTILNAVLLPIFRVIGLAFKMVFKPLKAVYDVISAIVMPLVAIGSAISDALLTPFEAAADALDPLFLKIGEFKEVMMKFAQPIIGVISSIGKIFGSLVGGAIGFFINFLVKGFGLIYDVISFIGDTINKYIVEPIMTAVNAIGGAFNSIGSFLGISDPAVTDGSTATTSSINDGVVQDGKVIGTNPADVLLATKDPASLLETIATGLGTGIGGLLGGMMGGGQDNTAVVAKLDELISAVYSNRDVYMDKEKVSSAVVKTNEKSGENRFGLMGA